jgi:RNA polymerase sigma-70 factor (TIGR02960 family)
MTDPTRARAQAGDGEAFEELVSPYRRELHVHCYRFLGSFQDAEDVLQETLLSAWQGLGRFDGRSLRAWLYRIATNRCLNYLRDASRRPQVVNQPESTYPLAGAVRSDDPWWLEPYPDTLIEDMSPGPEARYDTRESIALSFVAGLQHLPARQRAALVLRDVLGFSAAETAGILDSTPASVNSALQRARSGFRPAVDMDRIALPRSGQEADVVGRFVDAYERGDVKALVALLTQDARVTMPPDPYEFSGRQAVADHVRQTVGFWGQGLKLVLTRANNQPAVGYYLPDPSAHVHRAGGLLVLTVSRDKICAITRFADRSLPARFGLPRTLPSP